MAITSSTPIVPPGVDIRSGLTYRLFLT